MKVEKNYIPLFIWYVLPGINALCLLVIFPILIINTMFIFNNMSLVSVIGWILSGLIIGFLMDSMKLYRYTYKYNETSDDFFCNLSLIIDGKADKVIGRKIFGLLGFILRDEDKHFPLFEHSRWVMINHSSKVAWLSCFIWCSVGILSFLTSEFDHLYTNSLMKVLYAKLLICLLSALYLLIGFRLNKVSNYIRQEANDYYTHCAKLYKAKLTENMN
ncbi:hypothetical protein ASN18_2897 [Candidatus Magnetominusculus xianensis]|uniref:Uncharacterized protein n=1 Tax=Candidatus Magnetominusculus xianensis TaxID=1748249 RepID=A0ABR5SDF5_9BACT|nr:hypothetical protein ASN18_2897 [Candidatus Magnetominusculus xianensis]